MIDLDLLTPENVNFVNQFSEDFKFCTPIKSSTGNVFYPINHEKLFLRYYISFTGDTYDNVTGEFTYHHIEGYDKFITTDSREEIVLPIKNLVWRTYYRFPRALPKLKIDEKKHAHKIIDNTDVDYIYYIIDGVEFLPVKFQEDSLIYKEFIEKDKCKLIVSKDGAVFNIKTHRFLKVVIDGASRVCYMSQSGKLFKFEDFIISGWYDGIYDNESTMIETVAQHMIIASYDNLVLMHKNKYLHDAIGISTIVQHCGYSSNTPDMERYHQKYNRDLMLELKNERYEQLEIDKYFGKLYEIPIEGLQNYRLTKCGIIYSVTKKKILTPIDFIGKRNDVYDISYYIPELDTEVLISELILWTFYRLTRSTIAKAHCRIYFDKTYNTPFIDDVLIMCKPHVISQKSYTIGSEVFLKSSKFSNLYLSKNGAIYDSESASFILITGFKEDDGSYLVSAPSKKNTMLIDMPYEMYTTWIGSVNKGLTVIPKNSIYSDNTIINLKAGIHPSAYYIKRCYPAMQFKMFNRVSIFTKLCTTTT